MGRDPVMVRGNFKGEKGDPLKSIGTLCRELCKTAEPIEMLFGMLRRVDPRNHVLQCHEGSDAPTGSGAFIGVTGTLQSTGFQGIG